MNILPSGGNCESIVQAEVMMGPLSARELASLSHHGRTARDHWRVRLATRVCDNCPLSVFQNCEQQFFDEPGIRAGVYLSRSDVRTGVIREVTSWQSRNSAAGTVA